MSMLTEAEVESVLLDQLQELGYTRLPDSVIGPDGTAPERASYGDVILVDRLESAVARLNPYIPAEARQEAIKRIMGAESGHLEERVFWASIEANFIVVSQVRLHRVTHACPQAYFGMILARISGGIRILNRIRLWTVVAHGKRGGGSCSLGWPW